MALALIIVTNILPITDMPLDHQIGALGKDMLVMTSVAFENSSLVAD